MASSKTLVLVTGGNAGIGYELISQLLDDGSKHILLGSRSPSKGEEALARLQALNKPGSVELIVVDVADEHSITAAAQKVQSDHGRLDVLINNAGIAEATGSLAQRMATVYQTNVTGTLLMSESFEPLLRKANDVPRIINVSSGVGSLGRPFPPDSFVHNYPYYRCSKAAVNMVTNVHHARFGQNGFKVFSYCPGFTVSGLSKDNTAENGAIPVADGARPMVAIVNGKRDDEAGGFLRSEGQWPW